jgi:hypothetical protein
MEKKTTVLFVVLHHYSFALIATKKRAHMAGIWLVMNSLEGK